MIRLPGFPNLTRIILQATAISVLLACQADRSASKAPAQIGTIPGQEIPVRQSAAAPPGDTPLPLDAAAQAKGNADVLEVAARQTSPGLWTFSVTVHHPDRGWDDYADGWDVLDPQGNVLKPDPQSPFTRLLLHPHVSEQPFTRSQSGISIPNTVTTVRVRAHDMVDGWGGREVLYNLKSGEQQEK